ncbi:Bud-site selection protein [Geopyxis carbonaria]|nr:Bud-site selection protein [Geopyxis carbonaria]
MPQKRKHPHSTGSSGIDPRKRARSYAPAPTPALESLNLSDPASLPPRAIATVHAALRNAVKRHGVLVFRALKRGKPMETQKVVRRVKKARDGGEAQAVEKLEAELAAVKGLHGAELERLARGQVWRVCSRAVGRSGLWLPEEEGKEVEGAKEESVAERNVVSRMLGAPAVKEALAAVVAEVKNIVGMAPKPEPASKPIQPSPEAASPSNSSPEATEAVDEEEEFKGFSSSPEDATDADDESADDDEDNDEDPWDLLDAPDALKDFDARLASSDAGSDSDSSDSGDKGVSPSETLSSQDPDSAAVLRTDDEWSGSDDDGAFLSSDAETETAAPPPKAAKSTKSTKAAKAAAPAATSHFLPTLLSGYISGSASSDDDSPKSAKGKAKAKAAAKKGPPEKAVRKNRMGQQARRALWEKKFGAGAKHVQRAGVEEGWRAAQTGETKESKDDKKSGGKGGRDTGKGGKDGKDGKSGGDKGKDAKAEGPLHPSWEAARRAKEKQAKVAAVMSGSAGAGKKITFD